MIDSNTNQSQSILSIADLTNYDLSYLFELSTKFKNKEIVAFAGIGNPSNFFDLLKDNYLDVKETYSFPDHHEYSKKDFDEIINNKNRTIITTEKDFYRMNEKQKQSCDYLEIKLIIENLENFKKLIKSNV